MLPTTDADRLALVTGSLCTAVIGDVMDPLGLTRQFLPAPARPLLSEMVVAGRGRCRR